MIRMAASAENTAIAFAKHVDGKIRVHYSGWEDAKLAPAGGFKLPLGGGGGRYA